MKIDISFIIPVYNRPDETKELLESFVAQSCQEPFEVVIVEDGSTVSSKLVVDSFSNQLQISYYFKENSGPGDSRNYGMKKAIGNYFIILDSDCILPKDYLENVFKSLKNNFADCFGGPDAAHSSFSNLQKAINFSMTSFLTTGGIRGSKKSVDAFQPRSFNMGLSKKAFEASRGFGRIHPGEDPDLSIRLNKLGFNTVLFPDVIVFHKRRISWKKFYHQVHKFGLVRPILNTWHPKTKKITYWFPTLFSLGLIFAFIFLILGSKWLVYLYTIYFALTFVLSLIKNKNISVAIQSLLAILIQFFGYGYGFLISTIKVGWFNGDPEQVFPKLFFKKNS
jgi:glycosyltransferase involved in cell wall biosynthesis